MNITTSLEARLAKAKAEQNLPLVALLQKEQKVIQTFVVSAPSRDRNSLIQVVTSLFGKLQNRLFKEKLPYIEQTVLATGGTIWQGYDPKTGARYCGETEAEIVDWLETLAYQPISPSPYGRWGGVQTYRKYY